MQTRSMKKTNVTVDDKIAANILISIKKKIKTQTDNQLYKMNIDFILT